MRGGIPHAGRSGHPLALPARRRAGERRPRHVLVGARRDRLAARRLHARAGAGIDDRHAAAPDAVSAQRSGARRVSLHCARRGPALPDRRRLCGRRALAQRPIRRGNRHAVDPGFRPPRPAREIHAGIGRRPRTRQRDRVAPLAVHGVGRRIDRLCVAGPAPLPADLRDDRTAGRRPRDGRLPAGDGASPVVAESRSPRAQAQRIPRRVPADRRCADAQDRRRRGAAALAPSEVGGRSARPGSSRRWNRARCCRR